MSGAFHSHGLQLQRGNADGPPETFTTIKEVFAVTPSGGTRTVIDVTNHDSPSGFKEKIAGIADAGQLTFECNYLPDDATQDESTGVISLWESGAVINWQLVHPDSGSKTFEFTGFVQAWAPSAPMDDREMMSVTIEISGKPTWS